MNIKTEITDKRNNNLSSKSKGSAEDEPTDSTQARQNTPDASENVFARTTRPARIYNLLSRVKTLQRTAGRLLQTEMILAVPQSSWGQVKKNTNYEPNVGPY